MDGKGQNHGPGQSKALYSVRVLLGGGPELVGSMISVSGLVSWVKMVSGAEGLKRLMVSGAFGRWCRRVSGTEWSRNVVGLWSSWSLASKVTKTITFDVSGLNGYWSIGLSASVV